MKIKTFCLLALAALLVLAAPRPMRAAAPSFDFFYESLAPMGEWMEVGDYGLCWRPNGVDADWAPYTDGYWAYTDAGWTWVSYEDYGGIVYHYGRWVKVEDEGWCWKPDYDWAPAWVSWRHSDDYVGWAPLPPECNWNRERGISVWVDSYYDLAPVNFNFCRTYDLGAPVLRPVIINRVENVNIVNQTVNITNITYNQSSTVVYNGGPNFAVINRVARQPIPALKLVQSRVVGRNVNNFRAVQRGNQLTVVAPVVARPGAEQLATFKAKTTKVVSVAKVTRGWSGVAPAERTALKAKLQQDAKGQTPETAQAKPVQAADLAVVPKKADPKAVLPKAVAAPAAAKALPIAKAPPAANGAEGTAIPKTAAEGTAPSNPLIKPFNAKEAAATTAREKALMNKKTPAESAAPGSPSEPPLVAKEPPKARPEPKVAKPAAPTVDPEAVARRTEAAREAAAAKKQAAAEAAQTKAAEQQHAAQGAAAARQQAAEAAAARQSVAREHAAEMKAAESAQSRAAEAKAAQSHQAAAEAAAAQRERAAEMKAESAAHARQAAAERAPVQAPVRQAPVQPPVRQAPVQVQPNQRPAAPAANSKKKLTPAEEAAALKGQ